jgi:hypothetical protein
MSNKNYEYYDIFKKSCKYENGEGECTKTREAKKCVDDKCEKIVVPENKKQVLEDYYKQIKEGETALNYKDIKENIKENIKHNLIQGGGAPGKYNCEFCNKNYSTPSGLRHHMLLHKDKVYKCDKKDCYYKTSKENHLEKHMHKTHNNQEYSLEPVQKRQMNLEKLDNVWFEMQKNLQDGGDRNRSKINKRGDKIIGSKIPIKRMSITNILLNKLKDKYECSICHKYKYQENMSEHLVKHEKKNISKNFRCPICKEYFTRFTYYNHIDSHKNEYSPDKFPIIGGGNHPKDEKLYNSVKKSANRKFKSPSGIYRSSWIVKEYLRRGGKYSGKKNKSGGLTRWFNEKWVDINRPIRNSKGKIIGYKSCGRKSQTSGKYPLCRPSKSVNKKSPRTYKEISKKSLSQAKKDKSRIKSKGNIQFGSGENCCGQEGGYYGSPKLKQKLLSDLKKKECPVCKMIIKGGKEQHVKNHSLPPKKRKISQIGKGQCYGCGALSFAPLIGGAKKEIQCGGCGESCMIGSGKIRSQFKGTKSKIMVKVPQNVKKTALYSYKLKDIGFQGGIETGIKRAKQLSTKSEIPIEDLKYMRAWFARHIYASYPTYKKWQDAGRPKTKDWHKKRGILAWILWSGDAGFKWVNSEKNINLLNKHYPNKNYKSMKLKLMKK